MGNNHALFLSVLRPYNLNTSDKCKLLISHPFHFLSNLNNSSLDGN